MAFSTMAIERSKRPANQRTHARFAHAEGETGSRRLSSAAIATPSSCRLMERADARIEIRSAATMPEIASLQIRLIGLGDDLRGRLLRQKPALDLLGHRARDAALQRQDVLQTPLVALRPDVRLIADLDE